MKSSEKKWKINFSSIQKESHYCIAISQKPSTSLKNPIFSRITFCKYPLETIIAEETVGEEILYGCFNPKNTLELIICGKGYLRLWNVFINEGSLKENQQRFLRGKQEKEKTFIKAQFFSRKLFLLIVATKENMFFIFEGYQLIHELNVYYSFENIYDLNIQNLRKTEDDDDISKFQENFNSVKKDNLEETIENISELLSNKNNEREGNSKDSDSNSESGGKSEDKEKEKKIQKLYRPKGEEEENEKLVKDNCIKYFELINDNLLFVVYLKDGCCMFYKIDWNKKIKDDETEAEFRKWKAEEKIDYSLYGTPLESTTYKFAKCLQKRFGKVEGVTDKNYITNSYHIHVTENINAFDKLKLEAEFQTLSPGGAISYVEVPNMQNNIEAVLKIIQFIYDNIMYAELNTKSDYCQVCGYDGEIQIVKDKDGKLIWECPNCGNKDQNKLNVARRTCGYIGTQFWNQGRTQEIKERVLHLSNSVLL